MSSTVTLIGNITRDPELRFTPSGQAVATFGLAVSRRWQNRQSQEWEEATSFFDVVSWGSLAENVADSLPKGARVLVSGRLDQRSWETQDGEKRSKIEVVADEIGPSLRWAIAKPEKTDRRNGQGGGQGSPGGQGGYGGGQSGYGQGGQGGPGGQPGYGGGQGGQGGQSGQGFGQGGQSGYGGQGGGPEGGMAPATAGQSGYDRDEEPF
ncbi:MAG TPA: single-stranded DNA-binding protein [Acidimicrobiales bacterium]|jgi:single-strand DNA-binding protein